VNKIKLVLSGVVFGLLLFCSPAKAATTDMVDVSNNNGYMTYDNFVDMRDNYGVKAVVTKISEGSTFHDYTAANNIKTAQQAGLYINGYHFARYQTVQQAKNEADFACQKARADGLPVGAVLVADVEAPEQQNISYAQNNANNEAFASVVRLYGYRPNIYTMASWVGSKFSVDKGWIAHYPANPWSLKWYSAHHAWQFASDMKFKGSYGNFDVSTVYDNFYTASQNPLPNPIPPSNHTDNNVVTAKVGDNQAATMFHANSTVYDITPLLNNTPWYSDNIVADSQNRPMFSVGTDAYLPQRLTNLKGIITVNYAPGYGVLGYNGRGIAVPNSNSTFKTGTSWATPDKLFNIPNVGLCYQVSTDEYIPAKYQIGSGFKN
jgi:GH25 family lysozyme M1 (1,4-beta-N-acetylmuramidase)